jgi:uncharacterized membrane protein YdjX (TVP38/TMEM64 family)
MNRLLRASLIVALALLVPIVPFLLLGDRLETTIDHWLQSERSGAAIGWATVAILASDVLLPVPSSLVNTWAGAQLGMVGGTICAWAGMTLGGLIGFAVARQFGQPIVRRLAGAEDLARLESLAARYGWALLIATRPLPVLAEATLLLLGAIELTWKSFLPALLLSNLGLALAYAAIGALAKTSGHLPAVLILSVLVPIVATALVRKLLNRRSTIDEKPTT